MYALTNAADELFPVDYYSLTDYLLDELHVQLGETGIEALFNSIANRLAQETPPLKANQTVEERLSQLKIFLEGKGFVVDWESGQDAYRLHAYSCPYRQVAKEHGHVCLLDQRVIGAMLNTIPTRVACLTSGDSHCIYEISKPIELILEPTGV
jgi:predicted ArsR family transcriptional regulator